MQHSTETRSGPDTLTKAVISLLLIGWVTILGGWAVGTVALTDPQLSLFLLVSGIVFGTIGWLLRETESSR